MLLEGPGVPSSRVTFTSSPPSPVRFDPLSRPGSFAGGPIDNLVLGDEREKWGNIPPKGSRRLWASLPVVLPPTASVSFGRGGLFPFTFDVICVGSSRVLGRGTTVKLPEGSGGPPGVTFTSFPASPVRSDALSRPGSFAGGPMNKFGFNQ